MLPVTSIGIKSTSYSTTPSLERSAFLCEITVKVNFSTEKPNESSSSQGAFVFQRIEIKPKEAQVSALTELIAVTRRTRYVTYLNEFGGK